MGEVFAGRYELVDALGSGGVGTVWRVWDSHDNCYRAAKVLRQSDSESLVRFVRETTRKFDHDHVVAPQGWLAENDRVLFTMPLIDGGSVTTLVKDHGALPCTWAAELTSQLLAALQTIHAAGVIHRDVKPANLLLKATGKQRPHLMLSDFGAASGVDQPRLTEVDSVIGTPGYLAPERIRGADPDGAQDIYAAGVVLLEMLTGRSPARDGSLGRLFEAASQRGDAEELVRIARLMTHAEPGARIGSAECLELLEVALVETWVPDPDPDAVEVLVQIPDLPSGWTQQGKDEDATGGIASGLEHRAIGVAVPMSEQAASVSLLSVPLFWGVLALSVGGVLLLALGLALPG